MVGVLACATAVLGLVIGRQCWQQRKSRKACHTGESPIIIVSCHNLTSGAGPDARNVVYDEVILPPTSSSAVIPTEPNAAYVTHTGTMLTLHRD